MDLKTFASSHFMRVDISPKKRKSEVPALRDLSTVPQQPTVFKPKRARQEPTEEPKVVLPKVPKALRHLWHQELTLDQCRALYNHLARWGVSHNMPNCASLPCMECRLYSGPRTTGKEFNCATHRFQLPCEIQRYLQQEKVNMGFLTELLDRVWRQLLVKVVQPADALRDLLAKNRENADLVAICAQTPQLRSLLPSEWENLHYNSTRVDPHKWQPLLQWTQQLTQRPHPLLVTPVVYWLTEALPRPPAHLTQEEAEVDVRFLLANIDKDTPTFL